MHNKLDLFPGVVQTGKRSLLFEVQVCFQVEIGCRLDSEAR